MKNLLSIFILILTSVIVLGQDNAAHHWYFGVNAGVDFSTGIPTPVSNGPLNTAEGVATVDDANGNLQFYTDGTKVYNANHQIMPNGDGLLGHYSATQSSIVIPYPNNDTLYYLFTVDAVENHLQNGLRYSLINMNLDNGFGDVVSGQKNILLANPVSEKITAILGANEEDIWIIAHKWNSDEFISFKITTSGINITPVVSAVGSIHQGGYSSGSLENGWTNSIGYMKANMDGSQIALAIYRANIVELFNFSKSSGIVSNCITSNSNLTDVYGIEFSPDGTKLYTTQTDGGGLKQFDLTSPNPFANPYQVSLISQASALQIAPNGSIYLAVPYSYYLGVILTPNDGGVNCDFDPQGLYLDGAQSKRGLPGIFHNEHFQFITGSNAIASICDGDSIMLGGLFQTDNGVYIDVLTSSQWIDSLVYTTLTVNPLPGQPIITEAAGILWSTISQDYQWYRNDVLISGATQQTYQPDTTGYFSVRIEGINGCFNTSDYYYFEYTSIEELISGFQVHQCLDNLDILYLDGTTPVDNIRIYTISGALIKEQRNPSSQLMISDLNRGMYVLEVELKGINDPVKQKLLRF